MQPHRPTHITPHCSCWAAASPASMHTCHAHRHTMQHSWQMKKQTPHAQTMQRSYLEPHAGQLPSGGHTQRRAAGCTALPHTPTPTTLPNTNQTQLTGSTATQSGTVLVHAGPWQQHSYIEPACVLI
jgi:hypothetical protein